jgi:hypothetical protein
MANKDLSRNPHNMSHDFWWYEENYGISIIYQITTFKGIEQRERRIPWRSLRAALKRKDK